LGVQLDCLDRNEEAEAALRRSIELNPSHANAYYNLARLLYKLQRYEEAKAAYRKSIELNRSGGESDATSIVSIDGG
jgi:tetratricopeptide (TPR) repeat protein